MYKDILKKEIKEDEGLKLKLYRCTKGKLTIGYGHNIEDLGIPVHIAEALLDHDLATTVYTVEKFPWFHELNHVRKAVIANMVFNLGLPRFLGFKDMIAALERKDYERAAVEMMDSKWALDVGDGIGGRMDRAEKLAERMRTGK